jgi:serine/threonine-protein kinase
VALLALIAALPAIGGPGEAGNGPIAPASALVPFGTDANHGASPSSATQTSGTVPANPPTGNTTTTTTSGEGPPPVAHTINAEGGTVRMRCQGNAATLLTAEPRPGFEITDSTNRPTQVQVVFTSATHESDVRARCSPQGLVPDVKEAARPPT